MLFLHLGAVPAFEKVLPSKLFEYAALGKPVLAGVAGYAADFVRAEIDNAACLRRRTLAAAVHAFDLLDLGTAPRPAIRCQIRADAPVSRAGRRHSPRGARNKHAVCKALVGVARAAARCSGHCAGARLAAFVV